MMFYFISQADAFRALLNLNGIYKYIDIVCMCVCKRERVGEAWERKREGGRIKLSKLYFSKFIVNTLCSLLFSSREYLVKHISQAGKIFDVFFLPIV